MAIGLGPDSLACATRFTWSELLQLVGPSRSRVAARNRCGPGGVSLHRCACAQRGLVTGAERHRAKTSICRARRKVDLFGPQAAQGVRLPHHDLHTIGRRPESASSCPAWASPCFRRTPRWRQLESKSLPLHSCGCSAFQPNLCLRRSTASMACLDTSSTTISGTSVRSIT